MIKTIQKIYKAPLLFALVIGVMFTASGARAFDVMDLGPKVGDQIPSSLQALDHNNEQQNFETLKGEKGLILLFVRSVDWCTFCQAQVIDWNTHRKVFEDLGYGLAVISYDAPETNQKFITQRKLGLQMLSDPKSKIINAFGILNEKMKPESQFYGIPHPFIYVITPDKKITHRFAKPSFVHRPPVPTVYAAITGSK